MRFIILIFFSLFPIISNCQSWTYSKGGNVFDGEYKTASVRGKGDKYPYNNPLLVVNIFNGNDINFYISDAGFFQKETDISTTWIFDNEKNVRYENISLSISGDGKNLFFDSFLSSENSNNEFVKMEMIDKLTKGNILYVRVSDRFGSNDLKFSLAGSSNAIGYVISKSIREKELNILRKEKK